MFQQSTLILGRRYFASKFVAATSKKTNMYVASWNGQVIAESDKTIEIEGNQYFPPDSVKKEYLKPNSETSTCPWKGLANYCDLVIGGKTNPSAVWLYKEPKPAAAKIKGYYAFWKGVQVAKK